MEISTKFTARELEEELVVAGMRLESFFADADERFALALAAPTAP